MVKVTNKFNRAQLRREISGKLYDDLTKIVFTRRNKTFEVDLSDELLVSPDDLSFQIEKIPAVMGYLGSVVAILERECKDKEDIKKKIEAVLDNKIRRSGVMGEARIDKAIKRHPNWMDACIEVNRAKEKFEIAKSLYNAIKSKSMTLQTRANDIRVIPGDSIVGIKRTEIIKISRMKKVEEGENLY